MRFEKLFHLTDGVLPFFFFLFNVYGMPWQWDCSSVHSCDEGTRKQQQKSTTHFLFWGAPDRGRVYWNQVKKNSKKRKKKKILSNFWQKSQPGYSWFVFFIPTWWRSRLLFLFFSSSLSTLVTRQLFFSKSVFEWGVCSNYCSFSCGELQNQKQ